MLQKVCFPSFAPILGAVTAILVQTMIEFTILAVVLILFGNIGVTWLLFPLWLIPFVTFVTAFALSLAILNVHVRDLAHLTNVALQLLFFLTPIIYQIAVIPTSWRGLLVQAMVRLNPMAVYVDSLRQLVYDLQVLDRSVASRHASSEPIVRSQVGMTTRKRLQASQAQNRSVGRPSTRGPWPQSNWSHMPGSVIQGLYVRRRPARYAALAL
jgi:hypothetical protein